MAEKIIVNGNDNILAGGDVIIVGTGASQIYRNAVDLNCIKHQENFFKTEFYNQALKMLESEKNIILVGKSGIGKTELAYALIKYFMDEKKYEFRFVRKPQVSDFDNILNIIAENADEKEVIVLDDFLGDTRPDLSDEKLSSIENFLKKIQHLKNKRFIFSTQETFMLQLENKSANVCELLCCGFSRLDLNSKNLSDNEKILKYYHEKNKLDGKIDELQEKQSIINHENFTPLIVKLATKECIGEEFQKYGKIIVEKLEKPDSIWEKEVNALDEYSKLYLYILLSLSNNRYIQISKAVECFENYLMYLEDLDYNISEIHSSIRGLTISDDKFLYFRHSTLIEYLENKLKQKIRNDIIHSAVYFEQVEKMDKMDNTDNIKYISALMQINSNNEIPIFKLKALPTVIETEERILEIPNIVWIYYLKYLYVLGISDKRHQDVVLSILKELFKYEYMIRFYSEYIINVFKLNFDFGEIVSDEDKIKLLFSCASQNNIWYLIKSAVNKGELGYKYSEMPDYVKNCIVEILKEICVENLILPYLDFYVSEEMELYWDNDPNSVDIDFFIENICDTLCESIDNADIKKIVNNTLSEHSIVDFDDMDKVAKELVDINEIYDDINDAFNDYIINL